MIYSQECLSLSLSLCRSGSCRLSVKGKKIVVVGEYAAVVDYKALWLKSTNNTMKKETTHN